MTLFLTEVFSATNETNEIPALRPPREEIPPTFWETHGAWIVAGGLTATVVGGLVIWYIFKPRPAPVVPPEVRARQSLDLLTGKPMDREALSRMSQTLKLYLSEAFGLPKGEMTTAEFCQAMAAKPEVGPVLMKQMGQFLRRADEAKFAPESASSDFLPEAFRLVELGEARRSELRNVGRPPAIPGPNKGAKA